MVDAAYDEFGKVDILVNNAGMSPLAPSLVETTEELFDKIVDVNFKGPFRLGALVGAAHGRRRRRIDHQRVVVRRAASRARLFGPYAGAKAALNVLTEVLARAYGPKVRANTISAGPFLTDIADAWPARSARARAQSARPAWPSRGDRHDGVVSREPGVELHQRRAAARRRRPLCLRLMDELRERCAQHVKVRGIEPLTGGSSSLTFIVETDDGPVVLKVAPPGLPPSATATCCARRGCCVRSRADRVRVPEVLFEDDGDPPFFAMSFVAGECVEPILDASRDPANYARVRARALDAIDALAALHALEPRDARPRRRTRRQPRRRDRPLDSRLHHRARRVAGQLRRRRGVAARVDARAAAARRQSRRLPARQHAV